MITWARCARPSQQKTEFIELRFSFCLFEMSWWGEGGLRKSYTLRGIASFTESIVRGNFLNERLVPPKSSKPLMYQVENLVSV